MRKFFRKLAALLPQRQAPLYEFDPDKSDAEMIASDWAVVHDDMKASWL